MFALLVSAVPILLQILLVIHVLKTGRDRFWIFLLIFLPLVGGIAYLVVELLPEFSRSGSAHAARRTIERTIDPGRELRELEALVASSDTVANRKSLADAYARSGRYDRAIELYESSLSGIFADDPELLASLARAQFLAGEAAAARVTFERFTSAPGAPKLGPDDELLLARSLEAAGEKREAEERYLSLLGTFPGLEARYRYAVFLGTEGQSSEASAELGKLLDDAERLPPYARRNEKRWIDAARAELAKTLETRANP